MVRAAKAAATHTVRYRTAPDTEVSPIDLRDVDPIALVGAYPWREFRWYKGQRHYSGSYWSATEAAHVIYESRLELNRLMFADFDRSVHGIRAQPFLLTAHLPDGAVRKHIPDYLLMTDRGPKVVDVKPAQRLSRPEITATFDWTRAAIERRGWIYEVWSEPNEVEANNVRFLAGFRREALFDPALLAALQRVDADGLSIAEALDQLPDWPRPKIKSALFHLLWCQYFQVDMSKHLGPLSLLSQERQRE